MIIKKLNKPAMTREYLKERIYWSITLLAVDLGIYAHIDNTTVGQAFWIIITTVLWLWLASLFAELLSYKVFNESLCEGKRKEEFHNSLWVLLSSAMSLFMLWLAFFSIITLKSAVLWAIIANVIQLVWIILFWNKWKSTNIFVNVIIIFIQLLFLWLFVSNDKKNIDLNSDNNPFDFVLYLYLPSNYYFLNAKFFLRKAWEN